MRHRQVANQDIMNLSFVCLEKRGWGSILQSYTRDCQVYKHLPTPEAERLLDSEVGVKASIFK